MRVDPRLQRRIAEVVTDWWWPVASLVVVAAWVAVAVAGARRVPPLAAAVAAGTAALAASPGLPFRAAPDATALAALLVLPITVAEAIRGGNVTPFGIALCGVVALAAISRGSGTRSPVTLLPLAVGVATALSGVVAGSADRDQLRLAVSTRPPAAAVVAGAAIVIAVIVDRPGAERAVVAPVLFAALLAVPQLPPLATALLLGVLAVAAGALDRPAAAAAALALVAAAAGAPATALLLGAGAVLAWSLDGPAAALCALPGAVALAGILASRPVSAVSATAGAALGLTAVAALLRFRPVIRVGSGTPIGAALAVWLVMAPGSWRFTGVNGLGPYDAGAARAVAVAALVVVIALFVDGGAWEWPQPAPVAEPFAVVGPAMATGLRIASLAATVAAAAWLVISVVRLH